MSRERGSALLRFERRLPMPTTRITVPRRAATYGHMWLSVQERAALVRRRLPNHTVRPYPRRPKVGVKVSSRRRPYHGPKFSERRCRDPSTAQFTPNQPTTATTTVQPTICGGKLRTLRTLPAKPAAEFSRMNAADTPPLSRVPDQRVTAAAGSGGFRRPSPMSRTRFTRRVFPARTGRYTNLRSASMSSNCSRQSTDPDRSPKQRVHSAGRTAMRGVCASSRTGAGWFAPGSASGQGHGARSAAVGARPDDPANWFASYDSATDDRLGTFTSVIGEAAVNNL
jgi:hypothetical protein